MRDIHVLFTKNQQFLHQIAIPLGGDPHMQNRAGNPALKKKVRDFRRLWTGRRSAHPDGPRQRRTTRHTGEIVESRHQPMRIGGEPTGFGAMPVTRPHRDP